MGCLAAPSVLIYFSRPQTALQAAAATYSLWIVGGYSTTVDDLPRGIIVCGSLVGSFIIGLGAALLWVV
jgi:hypothetical protein